VFFDFEGIGSGGFEEVILENIKARAHFLVLLTPTTLERCIDPTDLMRREIETALQFQRNIVPIMLDGFDFGSPGIDEESWSDLALLKRYNGIKVIPEYFSEAMDRLRQRFLDKPLHTVLHPVSDSARQVAQQQKSLAATAPFVTEEQLVSAAQPRFTFHVKVKYQDELEKPEGTRAVEPYGAGGPLIIYDGESIIARYPDVDRWSRLPLQRSLPHNELDVYGSFNGIQRNHVSGLLQPLTYIQRDLLRYLLLQGGAARGDVIHNARTDRTAPIDWNAITTSLKQKGLLEQKDDYQSGYSTYTVNQQLNQVLQVLLIPRVESNDTPFFIGIPVSGL
jgi:hypothetical protein